MLSVLWRVACHEASFFLKRYIVKDFSYQFYPGDVLRDIQFFNNTQKGIYLTLMTCHIEKICFSYDFIMKITKELNNAERLEFMEIFTKIDEENYVILWVQKAIEKRSSYIASRSENKKGKTKNKDIEEESYDYHMVNENKNKNKDIIKTKEERISEFSNLVKNTNTDSQIGMNQSSIDKFINYWTESGERDKKLKFEKESTWNLKSRMQRWVSNGFDKDKVEINKTDKLSYQKVLTY